MGRLMALVAGWTLVAMLLWWGRRTWERLNANRRELHRRRELARLDELDR